MRFLVDECCAKVIADRLREAGHDVLVAQTANCGAPDTVLAQIAIIEARVIVSEDYDFGELAVRDALPIPGVILLSVLAPRKSERAARLIAVIDELGDALTGHLTIILPERIRRRRLR